MTPAETILKALEAWGIPYDLLRHEPTPRIEDCLANAQRLRATVCRNYFLATRHGRRFALLVSEPGAHLATASVSRQAGFPRLGFGREEDLFALTRAHAGAVNPLGLLFDRAGEVRLLLDRALLSHQRLAFHPCDNTMTLALSREDFLERFLPAIGREPTFVDMEG